MAKYTDSNQSTGQEQVFEQEAEALIEQEPVFGLSNVNAAALKSLLLEYPNISIVFIKGKDYFLHQVEGSTVKSREKILKELK